LGLFGATPELDQGLAQWIVAEEGKSRRSIEKALAKNQTGLAMLLEDSEDVRAITHGDGVNEILVTTDRRLLRVKRGKMNWAPIPLDEIAETSIAARDLGGGRVRYTLIVDTYTSKQYADGDQRRYLPDHFLMVTYDDPRDARAVCAVIDLMVGSSR